MSKHEAVTIRVPIEAGNPAIRRIESLCIQCGKCRDVCKEAISVGQHYDLEKTMDTAICIHCGQCANVCPTGAIIEIQDWMKVQRVIQKMEKRVVVITSPSVRVGLGEEFGLDAGSYVDKEMVGSLRALGVDYVFDTTFAADLTIMEEASELIDRIQSGKPLPQFTSCCPAWVKFVETYYPDLLPNMSTSKSPISMFAPSIKTYFAKKENIDPKDLYIVALTPCTAKKFEITRPEFQDARIYHKDDVYADCDAVITTRELANWLRAENMDLESVEKSEFDSLLPCGSGAGIIFGNTGGVMEAAIRSAYYFLTKEQPKDDLLHLKAVRGLEGIKTASLSIAGIPLKVAVIHGTDNARAFLDDMTSTGKHFDFVEVMTCPGGCIGGGGQPKHKQEDMDNIRKKRIQSLYDKDAGISLRNSHDNPQIKTLYNEFYQTPLSKLAEELLHTSYAKRDDLQEDPKNYATQYQKPKSIEQEHTSSLQYKCTICGYIYEGDITLEDDSYTCPLCSVPKEMFACVTATEPEKEIAVRYRCTICGYIYEGDITLESENYTCPICGVPKELFEKMND